MKKHTVVFLTLVLCSCAGYSRVPAGDVNVGNNINVSTPIAWSKKTFGAHELWTRDGNVLQELWFVKGLNDGEVLIPPVPGRAEDLPEYDTSMTLLEVPQFVKASLAGQHFHQIELDDARPEKFGSREGVSAKLAFLTRDGLQKSGRFLATKYEGELYLVMYTGVTGHYFDNYSDEAEEIMSSIGTEF